MNYKVVKVYDLLDKGFEELLNQMDEEGYALHSVIPQTSGAWEIYCYVVIFNRK